jgi:zinc protease
MKTARFIERAVLCILFLSLGLALWPTAGVHADLPKQLKFPDIEFDVPDVDTLAFANGLRGYLIEDNSIPLINVIVMYRTGFPTKEKVGLDDIAGWALRNGGSLNYPKDVIDDELEFVGASIESNAGSQIGQIGASFLTKDTDKVLAIFADLIMNPAFDAEKIELHKKTSIEDIRRKADDPRSLGKREFAKIVYGDHPLAWEPTVATVTNITRDDVIDFHARYVRPDNAVIGITGDITAADAQDILNRLLAGWEPGGEKPAFPEMEYRLAGSINYIYKDVNQAYIWAGHLAMNSHNEDLPVAEIMNYILGGGSFTSWITQRVRADEGLAYSAGSNFGSSPWGYGLFYASCQTRSDAAMRALGLMIEQIDKMKETGPSQEEVDEAKEAMVNSQVFDYESNDRIIRRLVWYDIVGLPLDNLEREFEALTGATLADVKQVGHDYLHPDEMVILVVGDQAQFDRPLSDLGEVNIIDVEKEVQ